jgi:hypothetical protein
MIQAAVRHPPSDSLGDPGGSPVLTFFIVAAVAVTLTLLPYAFAFGRKHHQRWAIAVLATVMVIALAVTAVGMFGAINLFDRPGQLDHGDTVLFSRMTFGLAVSPIFLGVGGVCWLIALVWSLTAVRQVSAPHVPDADALHAVSQGEIERRRAERRARGY